jgi:uncharacterized protein (DUF169 family)
MDRQQIAAVLADSLHLERPPVGLAFVEQPPLGVMGVPERAPSACTFWRRAEQGVFYAAAADHTECPIGVLTMGFQPDASEQARALETVGLFVELDYFSMDEVAHLPMVKQPHSGIVYGPLAELPVDPEVVLVVTSPFQAMLIAESGGTTALADVPQLAVMGRPACAAIPRALDAHQTTLSLGCIGARTYAELPEDKLLVAIPAERLEPTVERLRTLLNANTTLANMHVGKKAQFEQAATV